MDKEKQTSDGGLGLGEDDLDDDLAAEIESVLRFAIPTLSKRKNLAISPFEEVGRSLVDRLRDVAEGDVSEGGRQISQNFKRQLEVLFTFVSSISRVMRAPWAFRMQVEILKSPFYGDFM